MDRIAYGVTTLAALTVLVFNRRAANAFWELLVHMNAPRPQDKPAYREGTEGLQVVVRGLVILFAAACAAAGLLFGVGVLKG